MNANLRLYSALNVKSTNMLLFVLNLNLSVDGHCCCRAVNGCVLHPYVKWPLLLILQSTAEIYLLWIIKAWISPQPWPKCFTNPTYPQRLPECWIRSGATESLRQVGFQRLWLVYFHLLSLCENVRCQILITKTSYVINLAIIIWVKS